MREEVRQVQGRQGEGAQAVKETCLPKPVPIVDGYDWADWRPALRHNGKAMLPHDVFSEVDRMECSFLGPPMSEEAVRRDEAMLRKKTQDEQLERFRKRQVR